MRFPIMLAVIAPMCLAGAAQPGAAVAQSSVSSFDGEWSVQLVTEKGACDPTISWSLAVSHGHIEDSGFIVHTAGTIDHEGRVSLRMTHGADFVAASGRAAGQIASGAWRSPTRQCSGAWSASRS